MLTKVILALVVSLTATEPLLYSSPLSTLPFASYAPAYGPAAYPSAYSAVAPSAYTAAIAAPLSSVSAYSYGSSYSLQDYALGSAYAPLSPIAPLAYSIPYTAYADYFYRR